MTLGERLQQTRRARGLSQRAAALELGCAQMSYRLWELDVQRPGAERLWRVAQWVGIDAETLLRELYSGAEISESATPKPRPNFDTVAASTPKKKPKDQRRSGTGSGDRIPWTVQPDADQGVLVAQTG